MKNCIVKIIDNVSEKNDEGGLFLLIDGKKTTNAIPSDNKSIFR